MPTSPAASATHSTKPAAPRISVGQSLRRALLLCCPACGQGKIFRNWISMHESCTTCGRKFDRAPGYLLGSIYFNYGVTTLLVVILYFPLYLSGALTGKQLLWSLAAFSLLFPLWFFRYARALWIGFDERWDPWPNDEERRALARGDE